MAYYEKLPIYKQSLDLTVWIEKTVRNFPQYHKYTIGSELRNKSREITILIGRANVRKDRKELLLKIRDKKPAGDFENISRIRWVLLPIKIHLPENQNPS